MASDLVQRAISTCLNIDQQMATGKHLDADRLYAAIQKHAAANGSTEDAAAIDITKRLINRLVVQKKECNENGKFSFSSPDLLNIMSLFGGAKTAVAQNNDNISKQVIDAISRIYSKIGNSPDDYDIKQLIKLRAEEDRTSLKAEGTHLIDASLDMVMSVLRAANQSNPDQKVTEYFTVDDIMSILSAINSRVYGSGNIETMQKVCDYLNAEASNAPSKLPGKNSADGQNGGWGYNKLTLSAVNGNLAAYANMVAQNFQSNTMAEREVYSGNMNLTADDNVTAQIVFTQDIMYYEMYQGMEKSDILMRLYRGFTDASGKMLGIKFGTIIYNSDCIIGSRNFIASKKDSSNTGAPGVNLAAYAREFFNGRDGVYTIDKATTDITNKITDKYGRKVIRSTNHLSAMQFNNHEEFMDFIKYLDNEGLIESVKVDTPETRGKNTDGKSTGKDGGDMDSDRDLEKDMANTYERAHEAGLGSYKITHRETPEDNIPASKMPGIRASLLNAMGSVLDDDDSKNAVISFVESQAREFPESGIDSDMVRYAIAEWSRTMSQLSNADLTKVAASILAAFTSAAGMPSSVVESGKAYTVSSDIGASVYTSMKMFSKDDPSYRATHAFFTACGNVCRLAKEDSETVAADNVIRRPRRTARSSANATPTPEVSSNKFATIINAYNNGDENIKDGCVDQLTLRIKPYQLAELVFGTMTSDQFGGSLSIENLVSENGINKNKLQKSVPLIKAASAIELVLNQIHNNIADINDAEVSESLKKNLSMLYGAYLLNGGDDLPIYECNEVLLSVINKAFSFLCNVSYPDNVLMEMLQNVTYPMTDDVTIEDVNSAAGLIQKVANLIRNNEIGSAFIIPAAVNG